MLVLQHVWAFLEWKYWFDSMFERFLVSTVGFTTCLGVFWVKLFVLQHVWVFCYSKGWFYIMFGPFLGENVGFTACLGVFGVLMLVYIMFGCFLG